MRTLVFILVGMILLFGCIGEQETAPTTVNITEQPDTTDETPAVVEVNQTTGTSTDTTEEEDDKLSSKDISFKTKDSWDIHGTIYYSQNAKPDTGIILLHQMGLERSSYDSLIPLLHKEMPNADIIAIDLRGHGESTNLGTYQKFKLAGDFRSMTKDVEGAADYLAFHRQIIGNYYVVGASIGSTAAINYAAEDSAIQRVVMLSPGMDYRGVGIADSLDDYRKRLLIVAAEFDSSAQDAQTAYSLSKSASDLKSLKVYDAMDEHGTNMLGKTNNDLENRIVDFLKSG
jgi:pimeloyl-ACP methyl ester carboxylesterase